MLQRLARTFDSSLFMPHGHCYLWNPGLIWLHALSDSLIAIAYYLIPILLALILRKRKDIPFNSVVVMFGLFIFGCGTTHLLEVWTLWRPDYWISGFVKAVTAIASVGTAVLLVPTVPRIAALPSTAQLEEANRRLQHEMARRAEAEEALLSTRKLQSLGTFAGGVAHDFNNILGIISAHSALLSRGGNDAARERSVAAVQKAVARGAAIASQLLTFARQSPGETKRVPVNALVEELAESVRATLPASVTLSVELAPDVPPVEADPAKMSQALLNLCVNARDAMPLGGTLTLATHHVAGAGPAGRIGEDWVRISVADTGYGMDEETRRRVFEPFFTTKTPGQGTGLGLALVYGIFESFGGTAEVVSAPGEGARFLLWLPAAGAAPRETPEEHAAEARTEGAGEEVFVVEDEPDLREALRDALELEGYRVLEAADGEEALALVDQGAPFRVALIDLGLPKVGGEVVAARVLQRRPGVKVIVMSGNFGTLERGLRERGIRLLPKPSPFDTILRAVAEALA